MRRIKEGTSAVLLQPAGPGRIPWNVTAVCETFKISRLMRRHPVKGGSEYHSTAQLFRLEQWSNITQFLREVKPKAIFGLSQKISFTVITWNPESNCTCRLKDHFPIPLKTSTSPTDTTLDVMSEKHIEDYWNFDEIHGPERD